LKFLIKILLPAIFVGLAAMCVGCPAAMIGGLAYQGFKGGSASKASPSASRTAIPGSEIE
jgi:hypothetical protein